MEILDLVLVGEISLITAVVVQSIKSHPKVKGSDIAWWTGPIGIVLCVIWFIALGKLDDGAFIINFKELYRAVAIGVVGAVGASIGYNVQKFAPIPNLLPTSNELKESAVREETVRTALVVEASAEGVEPNVAKEAVGLEPHDPPPNVELEAIQPEPSEIETKEQIIG